LPRRVITFSKDRAGHVYIFAIVVILLIGAINPRAFKRLLKLVWVIISLIISLVVFFKVQDACSGNCSPTELSVALAPLVGISLYIWYQLFIKKTD
jgi:hypothetical protein